MSYSSLLIYISSGAKDSRSIGVYRVGSFTYKVSCEFRLFLDSCQIATLIWLRSFQMNLQLDY